MLITVLVVRTRGGTNTVNIHGFLHCGSWFLWLLGPVCVAPCKSCLRSSSLGKDHCPQIITTQTDKQCSMPGCCKQQEGSVHRDLCYQNWGPCYCNRATVILAAEVGNAAVGSLHSPVLLSTPQSCFLRYPVIYRGPYKTLFCSLWVAVCLQTGQLLTSSRGGTCSHRASKGYGGNWGAGATCTWVKGQGTPF